MRLIDADALIEAMKKTESEYENAMTCPSWWSAFNVISEQPTAYPVDKVVEELETDSSVKLYGSGNSDNYLIPVKRAIEIVKQGGVSDDVCEWEKSKDYPFDWLVGCDGCEVNHRQGDYCPRCGKKIKVVE